MTNEQFNEAECIRATIIKYKIAIDEVTHSSKVFTTDNHGNPREIPAICRGYITDGLRKEIKILENQFKEL